MIWLLITAAVVFALWTAAGIDDERAARHDRHRHDRDGR